MPSNSQDPLLEDGRCASAFNVTSVEGPMYTITNFFDTSTFALYALEYRLPQRHDVINIRKSKDD
jgi:hypothetical protein